MMNKFNNQISVTFVSQKVLLFFFFAFVLVFLTITGANAQTLQTTTTVTGPDGKSQTSTSSGVIKADAPTSLEKVEDAQTPSATPSSNPAEEEDDGVIYTGTYEGRRFFPDVMALHCKMNAEDVIKDINVMYNCINKYVTELNNPNSSAKIAALKDFSVLRLSVIRDMIATAMTKQTNINNFEETSQNYKEASDESNTEHSDTGVLIYTQSFVADILNNLRELQVQNVMFNAVDGIAYLDPSVIEDDTTVATTDTNNTGDGKDDLGGSSGTTIIKATTQVE